GDRGTAWARHTEALRLHHAAGNRGELMRCLVGLGCAALMSGEQAAERGGGTSRRFARGTRLFGAAEALRLATGAMIWAHDRPDHERCVAAAREILGEEAFAAAWAEGRALSLDAAVEYALEEDTQPGNSPQGQGPSHSTKESTG